MSGGNFLSFPGCYPKNMFLSGAVWSEITGAVCSVIVNWTVSVNQEWCKLRQIGWIPKSVIDIKNLRVQLFDRLSQR
jgi:hypothetical protein